MTERVYKGSPEWNSFVNNVAILIASIHVQIFVKAMKEETPINAVMMLCEHVKDVASIDLFEAMQTIIADEEINDVKDWLSKMQQKGLAYLISL